MSGLAPVSFRKGREHAPRLSEPYVRGRRHPRFWSEDEDAIIRAHYAEKGGAHCLALLPGRNLMSVYRRARELGVSSAHRKKPTRRLIGDKLDEAIREAWPSLAGKGAFAALAHELGVTPSFLSERAVKLALSRPYKKEPPWTPEEEALLRTAPVNNPDRASRYFAAHGFSRSPAAIMVRCKRVGLSRRPTDGYSGTRAARILGIDSKTMTAWLCAGDIEAERRGTRRLPQQGGDAWKVQPEALRRFVLAHPERIDIRKVDGVAFPLLMAAIPAAIAELVQSLSAGLAVGRVEISESLIERAAAALKEATP